MGALLAAGTNAFTGSWLGGGTLSSLELTVLRWIAEAVGYDSEAAGILTSGGSLANLSAVAAARARHGRDTMADGVLYVSEQGHASLDKAIVLLGYPAEAVRRVPVDGRLRIALPALRRMLDEDHERGRRPFFLGANAGTTNTGSIDPLPELAELCREAGLWFHVDAAYGGFAALTDEGRALLAGMSEADSLALDPHKWLYSPMGVGCLLVRDRAALESAFSTTGDYLKDIPAEEVSFFNRGPELSRPARVLAVWTLVRTVGIEALRCQVEADLALARLAEELLAASDLFEIACPTTLSTVAFRHRRLPDEDESERARRDDALIEAALTDGGVMISSTILGGRNTLRLVVQNHRTDESELRRSIELLETLSPRDATTGNGRD
jgi:glutamate/tyrosine decarboxylase-like PLP-dependent enzyme